MGWLMLGVLVLFVLACWTQPPTGPDGVKC